MSGFTLLKGNCPICTGARKDCRQSNETNLIFCHDSSANPTGYHFRGTDPHGFGMWQSAADADAFSDEAREERQREIEQRRIQWERERLEQIAHQLSAVERDRHYRKIFSQLKLSEVDRQDLLGRGFTDAEIKRDRFVTVEAWQAVNGTFPSNLPGLLPNNQLNTQPGYLFPVRDAEGRIVSAQLRLRDGESGRYRWLSAKTKRNPDGATPHLDGELPLALYRSSGKGVWLTEGTGAKPSLASKRLKASVIGAASGRFDKSPLALKRILEKLGNPRAIFVVPDAGDALNSQVMARWRQQIDFLQSLRLEIKIAWWGQTAKSQPDIDELGNYGAIDFISPYEFFEISDRARKKPERESLTTKNYDFNSFNGSNPDFEERIRETQRKLRSLSYPSDVELSQRYLPNELVSQLPKSGLIGIKAPKGCGKSVLLKELIAIAKKQGISVLSITPRIALGREQAVKWEITWIDDCGVMQTRAEDTSEMIRQVVTKREHLQDKLSELDEIEYEQLNLLSTLEISSLEQQKSDLRAEIEQCGEEVENINASSTKTLALCWDSLWRAKDRDLSESLIIVDEAELGFNHFVSGSTCKRNRPYLLKAFKDKIVECLMSGGRVVLSDADLTDLPINYIRDILPIPIKPFIVKNTYIGKETSWIVDFRSGGSPSSRGNTVADIIEAAKQGVFFAITTDSRAEAQAIEETILQELPNEFCRFLDKDEEQITKDALEGKKAIIARIDRDTTECDAGKKFIQNPNEQISKWKPRILIYTPSMGVGVSIDESTQRRDKKTGKIIPYFDCVFGLFFGVIEPSQCRQQLARVRANTPRIIWCKESNKALEGCSSFFPKDIKKQSLKYNQSALNILDLAKGIAGYESDDESIRDAMLELLSSAWDEKSKCWSEPSLDLDAAFKARENYSLWNLANLLREELEEEGHEISVTAGNKHDLIEELSDVKDDLKLHEATEIANAASIPIEEARQLMGKIGISKQDKRSAQKALLQDELPDIDLTPRFIKKAVVDNRRHWLNCHKLFWYYTNSEAMEEKDIDTWLGNLRKFTEGTPFMRDLRSYSPKVKALRDSGIFELVDVNEPNIIESDGREARAFLERCIQHKDFLQVALNIKVTKKSYPIAIANKILSKVGLSLRKVTRSKKDNRWALGDDFLDPDRFAVLDALQNRWEKERQEVEVEPVTKSKENQSQQRVEAGGRTALLYTQNAVVPPAFEEDRSHDCREPMGSLPQLVEALNAVDSLKEFETAIAGYENSEISDAIALADCLPQRQKLATFKDAQSGQAENSEHPSLCVYEPGEEVWFYSPHLEVKWNRGVVRAVGNGLVRVAKGAIGAWIDRCEKICPGDWQFQPE